MTVIGARRSGAPAWRGRRGAGQIALACGMVVGVAAIAAACMLRFVIAGHQPLWLDETWTGAIAAQPSVAAFWRQVWLDVNSPFYYLVMSVWQAPFGLSDASLRLPSAIFGAAGCLAVVFARVEGLTLAARITWGVLLALWIPGIWLAGDARCYTLLILLCTLQIIAFVRLLHRPTTGAAALWCAISALAILTHYHAAIGTALQGLVYLGVGRGKAVRTWPAALIFVPVAAWLAVHAPRIAAFTRPDVAWYPKLTTTKLQRLVTYVFGSQDLAWALLAIGVVAVGLAFMLRPNPRAGRAPRTLALWAVFAIAVIGAGVVIGMGFLRPSFTDRYLVPFMPALMLGVVIPAQALARRVPVTHAAVAIAAVMVATPWALKEVRHGWRFFSWEQASTDLMAARPERLVFAWDHPADAVLDPSQIAMVGGFFFHRAHVPVTVTPVLLPGDQDPNPRLVAAAKGPRTALIWAYDRGVKGTAARRFLPRLTELDPTLICHDYAQGSVGVLACDRQGSVRKRP